MMPYFLLPYLRPAHRFVRARIPNFGADHLLEPTCKEPASPSNPNIHYRCATANGAKAVFSGLCDGDPIWSMVMMASMATAFSKETCQGEVGSILGNPTSYGVFGHLALAC